MAMKSMFYLLCQKGENSSSEKLNDLNPDLSDCRAGAHPRLHT